MENRKAEHQAQCTFCELIHGSAEVSICHEDADAIAFMDIQPVNNGHVLVVPREHHESLLDVPEELGIHLFKITMRLANAIRTVTGSDDLNIVVNSGKAAGQDEPHYHVHIIPRRDGDGFDIPLPFNGSEMPDRTVLDAYAVRIISALRDPVRGGGSHGGRQGQDETNATPGAIASAPGERKTKAWRAERPVEVQVFSERAGDDPVDSAPDGDDAVPDGRWLAEEGAHGELRYTPQADLHDLS